MANNDNLKRCDFCGKIETKVKEAYFEDHTFKNGLMKKNKKVKKVVEEDKKVEEEKKVKSIVCLKVARDKDFFQVGSALLESVCKLSKEEGYSFIEVYPHEGAMICADFDSALQLYLANGFQLRSMKNGEAVLRKEL